MILYIAIFTYVSINKKSIIKQVTAGIGKKLNGKVSVQDVDLNFFRHFPNVSVRLSNISITDSMFAEHKHIFFRATHVFARLSIMKLLKKQSPLNGVTIENGSFYLYSDTSGYTNTYLFNQKRDTTDAGNVKRKIEMKSIILKKVSFMIDDRRKEKLHNFFINNLDISLEDKDDISLWNAYQWKVIHLHDEQQCTRTFTAPQQGRDAWVSELNKALA